MDTSVFRAWITSSAEVIQANRDHLIQLDAGAVLDAGPGAGGGELVTILGKVASAAEPGLGYSTSASGR